MEFEDILRDIGGWGKYQRNIMIFFLAPVTVIVPWFIFTNLFLVTVPDHWCYVPELMSSSMNLSVQRKLISSPDDPSCLMHNISYMDKYETENYTLYLDNTDFIPCVNGWIYDQSNYESTAATQWNLVCDKSHYVNLILTLQNFGGIIGTPIYSVFSDKFGRKMVYLIVALVVTIGNLVCSFAQDIFTFAVIRTIIGSIYPTILILPYILVIEIMPPERRTRTSSVWNFSWVTGMCIMPLIVYLSRSWKVLCWVNTAAGAIILLSWKFIPESPRWLVSKKRYEQAQDILLQISETNGHTANVKNLLSNLKTLGEKIDLEEKENKINFNSLIKLPRLRKHFIILTACCLANHTVYSIIHYNISNLEGNEFLVFFLLSVAEAPGCFLVWFMMERIGRRWTAVSSFMTAAIACAIPLTGLPYSDIVSSVIAKFVVAGLFMVTDQQICEIYPTVLRSFGMGTSKCIASGLAFCLPYVILLSMYGKAIPFVVISLTCFSVGILASFLPETLNKNLPQTASDAEEFGKEQKYFSIKK